MKSTSTVTSRPSTFVTRIQLPGWVPALKPAADKTFSNGGDDASDLGSIAMSPSIVNGATVSRACAVRR